MAGRGPVSVAEVVVQLSYLATRLRARADSMDAHASDAKRRQRYGSDAFYRGASVALRAAVVDVLDVLASLDRPAKVVSKVNER